ncbi:MAG TPA: TonB-dependent receptor [Cytophagaceae bacterium]|jgi:iron complex outermembrane receptor protein|nr:TonB-dependent receptor [Cytophagaceae bacterium]
MKAKRCLEINLLLVFAVPSLLAQTFTVSGIVKDADNRLPIPYCSVFIQGTNQGTESNVEGKFSLTLSSQFSASPLVISCLGYQTDTLLISELKNESTFLLRPAARQLEEVVVTGVSKATLIKENPIAISSISTKTIEKTSESNIIDVLVKNTPGLNAVKTGPNISKPFIRGLGYNRVLTLYDGMRQEGQQWGDEHGIEVDAYHIDKAEIIKGPSSLMYGSDALAGVVSMFPSLPKKKETLLEGKYLTEYQSNNGLIGTGLRIGHCGEHWMWTLRGSYRIAKNYKNDIDGRVYNTGFEEKNLSYLVGYNNSKGYSHLNFTLYDNLQGIPDGSRDSLSRRFSKQVAEGTSDDVKNRPVVSDQELNTYCLSPLHQHIQHYRAYSNHHYSLKEGDVDALFGFQQSIRREYNHPTQPDQPGLYVRLNTLNYGLRYNIPAFLNTELSVGINGMYQKNKNKAGTAFPIPDYDLLDMGVYVVAKWKRNRLTVSGGIRYDVRTINSNDFYVLQHATTGFDQHVNTPDTTSADLRFPSFHQTFKGISLSLGSTYQVNEHLSIKVNIARGYRAPNIAEIASNGLDPGAHIIYIGNRNFVPEFSLQEDIGVLGNFKEASLSLSLFNNNLQHYIYLNQVVDHANDPLVVIQGNKTYQYQQASAQLYGMEGSLDVHPNLLNGFHFSSVFSLVYGFNRKDEYKNKGTQGEYLPFIPPAKWTGSISQEIKIKNRRLTEVNAKVEVDYSAAQHRFLALYNTETPTNSYLLFHIAFGAEVQYSQQHRLQLLFQVNNLFNVAYQSNLSRLKYFEYYTQTPNGKSGIYSMGRNCSIKIIIPF